jgi:hypothetical protein
VSFTAGALPDDIGAPSGGAALASVREVVPAHCSIRERIGS